MKVFVHKFILVVYMMFRIYIYIYIYDELIILICYKPLSCFNVAYIDFSFLTLFLLIH